MPYMTLYIPFGDGDAEVVGTFLPAYEGSHNEPPEPADFYIHRFIVYGNDITQELMMMYKKVDNEKYEWYIDYITPLLIEQAQLQLHEDSCPQYEEDCYDYGGYDVLEL